MLNRVLGCSGQQVGAIGLGCAPMSVKAARPTEAESVKLMLKAADLGMTLWDTADTYCPDDEEIGHNERLIGAALKQMPASHRQKMVIATKGGCVRQGRIWTVNGAPAHIRQAIDQSLNNLGIHEICLYQLHRPDPKVPLADSLGAVIEARDTGKVRGIGLSNVNARQIKEALTLTPIVSVQNCLNIYNREPLTDGTLDICREHNIAFIPYCPLGGISLAKNLHTNPQLSKTADEVGISPQKLVLAWLLSVYEDMIPIPGCSRLASIEDCATAPDITLSPDVLALFKSGQDNQYTVRR